MTRCRLDRLVEEWDVTMTHAWFLDSMDTEIKGSAIDRPGGRGSATPESDA